jgi:hypothetical protein
VKCDQEAAEAHGTAEMLRAQLDAMKEMTAVKLTELRRQVCVLLRDGLVEF